jgi:cellulose synthase/poly-beta-1,6-N-acetylglucosamine synthase-like glycosyltransferase
VAPTQPGEPPFVTVIVPARDAAGTLGGCLAALLAVDYPARRREIVVVDNGSNDGTAAMARSRAVRCVSEPRRGSAHARNAGVAAARGELLVFTDADCLPTTGWLRAIVERFRDPAVGAVAGEILPYPPRTAAERHAARIRHLSPRRYLTRPILPFAVTANLAFRREVLEWIGPFDHRSPHGGESTDICTRFFRATDLRLVPEPRAIVLHRHRSTLGGFLRQQWGYGRGHAFLYMKYADEAPWGWRQTARAWGDLARSLARVAGTAPRTLAGRETRDELSFVSLDFVRKLALRLGFAREALAHGRLLL